MRLLDSLRSTLRALLFRSRTDSEMDRELRAHIEHRADDLERSGLARPDAERRARVEFGAYERFKEASHQAATGNLLGIFLRDLRYAIRQLRRSPGFTVIALATLALGIGAVTAIFSLVNTVLLKPFAFRDPGRLVVIREVEEEIRAERSSIPVNYRHYLRLKAAAKTIEDAAIFQQFGLSVSLTGDRPRIVSSVAGSSNFLSVLGVQPILGRNFVASDAEKGAARVVILSYAGWQTFFQGNPNVVGQTLRVGGDPATVIGVLPPSMRFPEIAWAPKIVFSPMAVETREMLLIVPLTPSAEELKNDTGSFNYKVIGRLKPGVTLEQANSELDVLQRAYTASAHLPFHLGIAITPFDKDVTSGVSGALWLMFAAVGGVLLIGCVNLANLQLARAVSAEKETAVRAALGASRAQMLTARLAENLVLGLAGGAAGVALAFIGVRFLITLMPANVPRLNEVEVDLPVLLFAAVVSIAASMLFGLLPALRSLRVSPQSALQANSSRTANTREGQRLRSILVAVQVACTVLLLIVTSLVLRSFSRLVRENRGFDSSHVTLAQVDLFSPHYDDALPAVKTAKANFVDRALAGLRQLPGVQSVALTSAMPLTGETWVDDLTRPDHPVPENERPMINIRWISPDYVSTMHISLVAGRNLSESDRGNPYVVLISERTAREAFGSEDPVGKQIDGHIPDDNHPMTVIGVVADTRINGLKDSADMVYIPYWGFTPWTLSFLVRSSQVSNDLIPEIRRVVWANDPTVAIPLLKSLDEQVSESVATDHFQTVVLTSFGVAALLLALLGIYGVLAYSVSLRQQEFGIRIALGSGKAALTRLVLAQAATPVFLGLGVGLSLAFVALRWVRTLLYQTPVTDPLAIAGSVLLLLAAAFLAACIPARRAGSVDPVKMLRNQ